MQRFSWLPFLAVLAIVLSDTGQALAAYSDEVTADNPVVWYRFDEGSGSIASSGSAAGFTADPINGGALTYSVPSAFPGLGTAVDLGPASGQGHFQIPGNSVNYGTYLSPGLGGAPASASLEFWINTTEGGSGGGGGWNNPSLMGDDNGGCCGGGGSDQWWGVMANGGIGVNTQNNPINVLSSPINDGNWHHIVLNRTGTNVDVYVDGALNASGAIANANNTFNRLGQSDAGANGHLPAIVDEVAIYDSALSPARIAAHFAAAQTIRPEGRVFVNGGPPGGKGKVGGAAFEFDTEAGMGTGTPVSWKVEAFQDQFTAGLRTEWYHNAGTDSIAGALNVVANNSPDLVFTYNRPGLAFNGPNGGDGGSNNISGANGLDGYPDAVINQGGLTGTNRVVHWTGEVFIPESGNYRFVAGTDQSLQITIGGNIVVNDGSWTNATGNSPANQIHGANFTVAPGGEWLSFDALFAETGGSDHNALYWDYDQVLGLGGNADFPAGNPGDNVPSPLGPGALIPLSQFRIVDSVLVDSLMDTSTIGGPNGNEIFMDDQGNMIGLNVGEDYRLVLTINGQIIDEQNVTVAQIPEPATVGLLLMGAAGLGLRRRRRCA